VPLLTRSSKENAPNDNPSAQLGYQAVDQVMPYWSRYLRQLHQSVTQVGKTKFGLGVLAKPGISIKPAEVQGTHRMNVPAGYRARHPSGDRRMSVEQRRQLFAQPAAPVPLQHLPYWADYLARLGKSLNLAVKTKHHANDALEPRASENVGDGLDLKPVVKAVKPIGDRRTRTMQRRNRTADRVENDVSLYARLSLGLWVYYFIAKLALFGMKYIDFHALENLAFSAFILIYVSSKFLRRVKNVITALLAVVLLYYDSWLPPIERVFSQASLLSDFSFAYLIELLGRFVSFSVLGMLLVSSLLCWMLSRRLRMSVLLVVGMLVLGVVQGLSSVNSTGNVDAELDKLVQDFFAKEAQRSISFVTPKADAVPFDVIFIHVCSLSWDDVQAVGLEQHPLWQNFDLLLKKFNSAASYSGPAALHLLRAKCGQPPHGEMYIPAADECYLMSGLQKSGFETNVALNHDGKFDDFLGQLKIQGRLDAIPLPLDGLTIAQYAFDKSPVYDDSSVFDRWLDERKKSKSSRIALYYNTVSMHDGNYSPNTHSAENSLASYKVRLSKFLDDMDSFMKKLEQSGRRAVVVMVPEHGAAVRGDKKQIAGLREIPTPSITLVPVGIKVIGGNVQRDGDALSIDRPTSYLAISYLIERMLEQSPFANNSFMPSDYVDGLPITPFVAQTDAMTVTEYSNQYYFSHQAKNGKVTWSSINP
jgi:cellulose synthase operon protein YhjU